MAKFDPTKLTLGEVARVEELSGVPFDQIDESPKGLTLAALLFVKRRREAIAAGQPPNSVTWEQVQNVPLDAAQAELDLDGGDEEPAEGDAAHEEVDQVDPPAPTPRGGKKK